MSFIFLVVNVALTLFYVALLARIIIDAVRQYSRHWRPRGITLAAASSVYLVTDPPVKQVQKWLPPLRMGGVALDLGLLVVFVLTWILLRVTAQYAA